MYYFVICYFVKIMPKNCTVSITGKFSLALGNLIYTFLLIHVSCFYFIHECSCGQFFFENITVKIKI